ncbi:MAG: hypothetical protein ACOCX1_04365 [Fimbriimonadaceae bacterium]
MVGVNLSSLIANEQTRARKLAEDAQRQIRQTAVRISEAEKVAGIKINLPAEMRKEADQDQNRQSFREDGYLNLRMFVDSRNKRAREMESLAWREFERKRKERQKALDENRKAITQAWEDREQAVATAEKNRLKQEHRAVQDLSGQMEAAANLQKGCFFGAGMGCSIIALYFVALIILSVVDVDLGPETVVGQLIITLGALPIVGGVFLQVAHFVKQSQIDAELRRRRDDALRAYEREVERADKVYRELLPEKREAVANAEMDLKRIEEGLQTLNRGAEGAR